MIYRDPQIFLHFPPFREQKKKKILTTSVNLSFMSKHERQRDLILEYLLNTDNLKYYAANMASRNMK